MRANRGKRSSDSGHTASSDSVKFVPTTNSAAKQNTEQSIELTSTSEEKDENGGQSFADKIEPGSDSEGRKTGILGELSRDNQTNIVASVKHKDVLVNFSESLGLNDPKISHVFARFMPSMFLKRKKFFVPKIFEVDMSQYDPAAYVEGHFKEQIRSYELNWVQRFFVTLEIHDSSYMSILYFLMLQGSILLSAVSMVSASLRAYQVQPETCTSPICNNDATLCPNIMVCEPQPLYYFEYIDFVCAIIFGCDYICRLATCYTVSPILSNIVLDTWHHHEFHKANIEGREPRDEPKYSAHGRFFRYFFSVPNLIDLASFLPYFVDGHLHGNTTLFSDGSQGGSQTMVVRLVRLLRLLRLFKLSANSNAITHILYQALSKSFQAGSFILFCVCVGIVLFGSVIYALEGGDFRVTDEYPRGQYYRKSIDGTDYEVTPYQSIPVSMYWAVVTLTTLGYGDFYPTTPYGRLLASICSIFGVLVLAFPVSLLGTYFNEAHHEQSNATSILHKIDLAAAKFLVNLKGCKPIKNVVHRGIRKIKKAAVRMIDKDATTSDSTQDNYRRKWLEIIEKLKKLQILKTTAVVRNEASDKFARANHRASVDNSGYIRKRLHPPREQDSAGSSPEHNPSVHNSVRMDHSPSAKSSDLHKSGIDKEIVEKIEIIMKILSNIESREVPPFESNRLDTELLSQKIDQNLYFFHELNERITGVNQQQTAILSLMKKYDVMNDDMMKRMQVLSSRMNKLNEKLNLVEKQTTQHHIIIHTDNAAPSGSGGASMSRTSALPPISPADNQLTAETVSSTGRLRMIDRVINSDLNVAHEFNHDMYNTSVAESRIENTTEVPLVAVDNSESYDETVNGSLDEYEYDLYDDE